MRRLRSAVAAAIGVVGLGHVALHAASGWIARTVLAHRTLDGEPQTPEQWTALLRAMIVRSGVVACAALGVVMALLSFRRTREELRALFTRERGPLGLAVFRIVCFASVFLVFDAEQPLFFARLPRVLMQGLTDPLPLWRLVVPSPAVAAVLVRVFFFASFLAMIGLFTRVAALLSVLSGFYVLGLSQVFGKVDHYHHVLWFALILALSPSGDALSVDALLRARRPAGAEALPRAPSVAYALPLTMIWMLIGVIYFWPGFWKLVQHGPAWVFSDNFVNHLYLKWFEDQTFTPLFRIDRHPRLCHAAAGAALVWELSFVFLVPFARTRPFALAFGLAFHNATYLLMNIAFVSLQISYLVFVDWDRVRAFAGERIRSPLGAVRRMAAALLARVDARWIAALAPRPVSEQAAVRHTLAAGLALIAVNMAYGATHHTSAWPFACYPTFSSLIKRERRSLVVTIEDADTSRPARTAALLEAFRSERYAAVVSGITAERDEARRRRKLAALASIVQSLEPTVRPGDTIVISAAVVSTDPDAVRAPQREERLYTFQVGTD